MEDSVPSLKEIRRRLVIFFISSLLAISFWAWIYYNISTIIEILVKNTLIMIAIFIINWIVPTIFVYFVANSLNKEVSFKKSLFAVLLSNIVYIITSLIIFALFPHINQILATIILIIIAITLLIVFILIYERMFNVNWINAFGIVSTYALISIITIILIVSYITFNPG
jgi:hypothetical protein